MKQAKASETRRIRYQEIADALRVRATRAPAGTVLPSEAELTAEFDASRVTVRRALELVRDDGIIAADIGKHAERRVVEFAFEAPPPPVRELLGVDQVLRVKRVNLADGEPFAVVTVWCPAELGKRLSRQDVERHPFYELLRIELRGATQTIGADAVEPMDAALLEVPVGSPVLKCRRVTTDIAGSPVLVSEHLFPAHRTEFVVDLPQAEPSTTPTGLRLVD
jgi:GntR family transcriptional regulator